MSHDRKPGRVRVVPAGTASPQRRHGEGPVTPLDAASIARLAKSRGRVRMLLAILFILSSVGAGIAVELRPPS